MIDSGLLFSALLVLTAVWAAERWVFDRRSIDIPARALDIATTPLLVGVAVARLTAVLIDDPGALSRVGDLLIIRSGVEFWPGVAAGIVAVAIGARREGAAVSDRLAGLAPTGLVAYAAYAATCALREGCFGPASSLGLVPRVGGVRQFPVELVVAAGVVVLAVALGRAHLSPVVTVATALAGLAVVRLVAAIWLPRVGTGVSRLDVESAIALASAVGFPLWRRAIRR